MAGTEGTVKQKSVLQDAENLGGTVQYNSKLSGPQEVIIYFLRVLFMSEHSPTFTDDDTAYSWLSRIKLSNGDILCSRFGKEIQEELSLLRQEGTRNPIGGFYFLLGDLLKQSQEAGNHEVSHLLRSTMDEVSTRFLEKEMKEAINRLLSGEITIIDA